MMAITQERIDCLIESMKKARLPESAIDEFREIVSGIKLDTSQLVDSANSCKCNEPDNDGAPYGDHCLNCGGIIE